MGRGATLDQREHYSPNDEVGVDGELPSFPGRRQHEPRPLRDEIDTSSIEDAMRRSELQSAQRDYESDPRALLIKVTHWIPEPVIGLPNASQRAERFADAMQRVAVLLEAGDRDAAFIEFCAHASEVDTAFYMKELSAQGSERHAAFTEILALFVQNGRALEEQLRASVDYQRPGQQLRTLEELNLAEGKSQSENLEALYRDIILVHAPTLAERPAAEPSAEQEQDGYEAQLAAVTAFNEAVQLYRDEKFSEAAAAFKKFTEDHPSHELQQRAQEAQSACFFARAQEGLKELRALADSPDMWELASTKIFWREGVEAVQADVELLSETHSEKAASLLAQLGDLHSKVAEHEQALECYSRCRTLSENGPLAAYGTFSQALAQQELGQDEAAAKTLTDFVERFPNDSRVPEALLRQAHLTLAGDSPEAAIQIYRKLLDATEGGEIRERALFECAQLQSAEPSAAIALLTELKEQYPESQYLPRAEAQLAKLTLERQFAEAERLSTAPETWEQALAAYTEIAEQHVGTAIAELAQYRLIYHHTESGDFDKVQAEAAVFLERYPQSEMRVDVRQAQAQALSSQGQLGDAVRTYSNLLKDFPEDERKSHWQRAVTALGSKQRTQEFNALRELSGGEPAPFASALDAFIERYPGDERIEALQFNLAARYAATGSNEQALGLFSQLQHSNNSEVALRSTLASAQLQLRLGNQTEVQALTKTLLADQELPASSRALAEALRRDSIEADLQSGTADSLARVADLLPEFPKGTQQDSLRFSLVEAFQSAGLSESAVQHANILSRESRSVYGLKARLALGSMLLQSNDPQAAGIRFAEVANTAVLESYSAGFRAEVHSLQIEGLLGMCEAYAALGSQNHLAETRERVRAHPGFSEEVAQRLARFD